MTKLLAQARSYGIELFCPGFPGAQATQVIRSFHNIVTQKRWRNVNSEHMVEYVPLWLFFMPLLAVWHSDVSIVAAQMCSLTTILLACKP